MNQSHSCHSPEELISLAAKIARELEGGEIFALTGDLGLGKTTFVKGLAQGLGFPGTVTSPTFNLVHRYTGGRLTLIHYDLYRLKKSAELEALDLETELQTQHVLAIEWPKLANLILPAKRTRWILFEELNDTQRKLTISSAPMLSA